MYKIIYDFGSLHLDPLYIVLVVSSLLLLAIAQSYASAKAMKIGPALIVSLAILLIGDGIVWYTFVALFRSTYGANYTFPHVSIYSYGFMLMVAFVIGTIWLIRQGSKAKPQLETDTILDLMVFIIIGSIIGARIVYILTQWSDYKSDPKAILQITQGGLSIHGGILGAMVFAWIYAKVKRIDFWKLVDFAIPGVPLGMFFGRIGCLLNGCCFGTYCQTDWPFKVKYPDAQTWISRGMTPEKAALYDAGPLATHVGPHGEVWRHMAPMYEAVGALAIFFYLLSFRKHSQFKGHTFLMFVWLYSLLRFFVEFYRFGDPTTGVGSAIILWKFITEAQLASLILGVVAFILMQDLKRRAMLSRMLAESTGGQTVETGFTLPPAAPKAVSEEDEEEEEPEEEEEAPEEEEKNEEPLEKVEGENPPEKEDDTL